jgi:hypothetical protein
MDRCTDIRMVNTKSKLFALCYRPALLGDAILKTGLAARTKTRSCAAQVECCIWPDSMLKIVYWYRSDGEYCSTFHNVPANLSVRKLVIEWFIYL